MKLLLFAGKGGVGKTTLACASALGLAEAWSGKEILLFSIDPAHSLAACLGREIGPREVRVAPGLTAIELDAQAEYERLKQDYADELTGVFERVTGQTGIGLAFDREVMERILDLAPPGLDEMLALTRIVDLMDRGRYDLFVLDTAPTGHLLRFLEMPELIEKWLKTFFGLFLKYREVFWLPRISQMMVELSKRVKVFRRMLIDSGQAALVAVTIPTEMAYAETSVPGGRLRAARGRGSDPVREHGHAGFSLPDLLRAAPRGRAVAGSVRRDVRRSARGAGVPTGRAPRARTAARARPGPLCGFRLTRFFTDEKEDAMESDRNSRVTGSSAVTPGSGEPAALEAGSAGKPEAGAAANQALLGRLLTMAHRYRSEGNFRQATELYWTLAEDYPGTPQADAARAVLLELTEGYERNGARHMTRSMYERLLNLEV